MKSEIVKAVTQRYVQRIKEVEETYGATLHSHFSHVARNLAQSLFLTEAEDFDWARDRVEYVGFLMELKTYLRLIETVPRFRDAEMNTPEGYFPCVDVHAYGAHAQRALKLEARVGVG